MTSSRPLQGKLWRTKAGVLVEEVGPRLYRIPLSGKVTEKIYAYRVMPDGALGGFHGVLNVKKLRPVTT